MKSTKCLSVLLVMVLLAGLVPASADGVRWGPWERLWQPIYQGLLSL